MSRRKKLVATALAVVAALAGYGYVRPVSVLEATGELWLRLSGVRSSYVQAGRYRLRVLEKGSGPPLVLVHGLGSSAMVDWGRLIAPLGRRYHVYALDLPGFGRSERPKDADYSIPMQVEAVRSFMAAAGVSRARVAGISMGGWIVARLAGEHPELVERLVAAGVRVGVVSNWSPALGGLLEGLGLLRHLDPVVCSALERVEKPDPAIFLLALRRAGLPAAQALHAGDHPDKDVAAARSAGLESVLVDHDGGGAAGEAVGSLPELAELVLARDP